MERIVNQSIREQQDEAYRESLRADQEKQRQRELEMEEQRKIEREKQKLVEEELQKKIVRKVLFCDFTFLFFSFLSFVHLTGTGKSKNRIFGKNTGRAYAFESKLRLYFLQNAQW